MKVEPIFAHFRDEETVTCWVIFLSKQGLDPGHLVVLGFNLRALNLLVYHLGLLPALFACSYFLDRVLDIFAWGQPQAVILRLPPPVTGINNPKIFLIVVLHLVVNALDIAFWAV
jgi:hypothetical protein